MYLKRIFPLLISMLLVSGCAQTGNGNIIIESQSEEETSEASAEESKKEESEEAEEATEETSKEEAEESEASASKEETSDSASAVKTEAPAKAEAARSAAAATASVQQAPAQSAATSVASVQQAPAQTAPAQAQATQAAPAQVQTPQETPAPVAAPAPVERKLGNCGKAYEQIAKDYHSKNSNYKYNLAYTNEDDIPELVIDKGKWICLYTFQNGSTRCMQKDWVHNKWTYGTSSICYSPKRNLFFNNNNNYYGDYCYESSGLIYNKYMTENVKIYPAISRVSPSSGAPYPSDSAPTVYKDGCGNPLSDEEGTNVYSTYAGYEWQKLEGTMDYDSLLARLEELGL